MMSSKVDPKWFNRIKYWSGSRNIRVRKICVKTKGGSGVRSDSESGPLDTKINKFHLATTLDQPFVSTTDQFSNQN